MKGILRGITKTKDKLRCFIAKFLKNDKLLTLLALRRVSVWSFSTKHRGKILGTLSVVVNSTENWYTFFFNCKSCSDEQLFSTVSSAIGKGVHNYAN